MSLNHAQSAAIAHNKGPCMVLAGPGSGKTLTIVKRIEYLILKCKVRPEEILVITFTKYAANEMKTRFQSGFGKKGNAVTFGTFHGVYYGILKWAYGLNPSAILSEGEKYEILRKNTAELESFKMDDIQIEQDEWKEIAAEIGYIKNNCYRIENYNSKHLPDSLFRELYQSYEAEKHRLGKMDFEDILLCCKNLFLQRPDILGKWQKKFRYILIDEFQDINQVQYDVIRMLAEPENNLFVVGDDDQSVYGFRGAKPEIMQKFRKDYPDVRQILLNVNYRCTDNIVKSAMRVIGNNHARYDKRIVADRHTKELVHVQEVKNPAEEGAYIADQIQALKTDGIPFESMAVLYRTNLEARVISEILAEKKIPYNIKERMTSIYDGMVGGDLYSYLRLASGARDRRHFLRIMNRPKRYLSRESMEQSTISFEALRNFYCDKSWMQDRIDQLEWDLKMMSRQSPFAAIQYVRKSMGYDEFLKEHAAYKKIPAEEYLSEADEIQQMASEFCTIEEWFAHIEEYRKILEQRCGREKQKEGVSFLTFHGAKGLEFDTVFMIHCNEGCIPYKKAKTEEETEEERRLFYVGMTRAQNRLVISYVKEKNGKDMNPSRFVDELFRV